MIIWMRFHRNYNPVVYSAILSHLQSPSYTATMRRDEHACRTASFPIREQAAAHSTDILAFEIERAP